jgi:hypothetical protein
MAEFKGSFNKETGVATLAPGYEPDLDWLAEYLTNQKAQVKEPFTRLTIECDELQAIALNKQIFKKAHIQTILELEEGATEITPENVVSERVAFNGTSLDIVIKE